MSFVLLGAAIAVAGLVAAGEGNRARDVELPIKGPQAELRLVSEHDNQGRRGVGDHAAGSSESPLRLQRVVASDVTREGRF